MPEFDVQDKDSFKQRHLRMAADGVLLNELLAAEGYVLILPRRLNNNMKRLERAQEWRLIRI